jgi:magnesium transporter
VDTPRPRRGAGTAAPRRDTASAGKHHSRRSVKTGMPAGSLVYLGHRPAEKTTLQVIDYDAENIREIPSESLEGCLARKDTKTATWINVDGLQDVEVVQRIGDGFGIHPLVLEDILNTGTRPKLEDYEGFLFVIVKMLSWDDQNAAIASEQLSLVLGPRFLLTFQEKGGDVFDSVRERLRAGRGRLRKMGVDYLMYAMLDAVVDHYFLILEKIGDRIEELESEVTDRVTPDTMRRIHRLKRQMIDLRHAVWPLREVVGGLARTDSRLIQKETRLFLRDVYDHTVQVVETVETYRDLLGGMIDIYMSTINNRLNGVMKVLTMIATIFIPLTFIAGVYGMNFQFMPELQWRWGYPLVMTGMLLIALAMMIVFKRRGWF